MDAVLSGHAGVALLLDGDRLSSIHFEDSEVLPRTAGEVHLLFAGAQDLQFLKNVGLEEVQRQLDLAGTQVDALHLALNLLDPELSHDTRRSTAEDLEELLKEERILCWVESVLFAHPLPSSADPVGARSACTGRTEHTRVLLAKLESLQPVIAEVQQAWEAIPARLFSRDEDRTHARFIAVKEGLFRDLVTKRAAGEHVNKFLLNLTNPALRQIRDARHILLEWIADFHEPRKMPPPLESASRHLQEIHEDLDRLAQQMEELRRQYSRWHERLTGESSRAEELPAQDVTMHLRARRLFVAAMLILVMEMGLAGFIASSWLNFSPAVALTVGTVLATILAAIADALMGLMEDPENPRTSEAQITAWARWLTLSCLVALTAICLTRFFDADAVFRWASGALAILLPATAGSYLTLHSLLETGNRIANVWNSLGDKARQTRILRDEADAQIEELRARVAMDRGNESHGEPRRPRSDRGQGGPRAATWLLIALLLPALIGFLARSAQARSPEPWNGEVVQIRVNISGSLPPALDSGGLRLPPGQAG